MMAVSRFSFQIFGKTVTIIGLGWRRKGRGHAPEKFFVWPRTPEERHLTADEGKAAATPAEDRGGRYTHPRWR